MVEGNLQGQIPSLAKEHGKTLVDMFLLTTETHLHSDKSWSHYCRS